MAERTQDPPLRIGVSQCLLGDAVRYDGGHRRNPVVAETLAKHAELVAVCPEVELGLGVPRETIQLVTTETEMRLLGAATGTDHTEAMRHYAARRARELSALGLCGFVLKKDSPSCGLFTVRVLDEHGAVRNNGRGLFAAALIEHMPDLPVVEDDALVDETAALEFLARVVAYRRK